MRHTFNVSLIHHAPIPNGLSHILTFVVISVTYGDLPAKK